MKFLIPFIFALCLFAAATPETPAQDAERGGVVVVRPRPAVIVRPGIFRPVVVIR